MSVILVDADTAGITVTDLGDKLGMKMTKTANIEFKDVKVPAANLIGKEGNGFKIAEDFNVVSQIIFSAISVGIAQGALEKAIQYAKGRVQFHRKIAQFQLIQHKIAEMTEKVEQSKVLAYQAAWWYDQKKPDPVLSAVAKSVSTTSALDVSAQAIQIYGGYGYMTEYEVESYYRDAKVAQVIQGNRADLKNSIAQNVIGKIK